MLVSVEKSELDNLDALKVFFYFSACHKIDVKKKEEHLSAKIHALIFRKQKIRSMTIGKKYPCV